MQSQCNVKCTDFIERKQRRAHRIYSIYRLKETQEAWKKNKIIARGKIHPGSFIKKSTNQNSPKNQDQENHMSCIELLPVFGHTVLIFSSFSKTFYENSEFNILGWLHPALFCCRPGNSDNWSKNFLLPAIKKLMGPYLICGGRISNRAGNISS